MQRNQVVPHQSHLGMFSIATYENIQVFSVTNWVTVFKSHSPEFGERETDKEDGQL